MPIVEGIALWASVQEPNTTFDPRYSIDLVIDDETKEILEAQGLPIKKAEDVKEASKYGKWVVKFKQPAINKKTGQANPAPIVLDAKKNPFTDLIGNGSRVKVAVNISEWSFGNKKGIAGYLKGVQVLDLVPYSKSPVDEFEEEDGFTAEQDTTAPFENPFA